MKTKTPTQDIDKKKTNAEGIDKTNPFYEDIACGRKWPETETTEMTTFERVEAKVENADQKNEKRSQEKKTGNPKITTSAQIHTVATVQIDDVQKEETDKETETKKENEGNNSQTDGQ